MYRVILTLIVLPLVFTACGKSCAEKQIESAIEKGTGKSADVEISKDGFEMKTADGTFKVSGGGNASLPEGFPSDVYVEKGAAIISSANVPGGKSVTLRSDRKLNDVMSDYKKEMGDKGWSLTTSMNMGEKQMSIFTKGERVVTMMLDRSENSTMVALTLADK